MGRIVVGVDGSPDSHRALAFAAEEARMRGATLHVIHSWTFPPPAPGADGLPHADLQASAEIVLDEALATLGDEPGVVVQREVANDLPGQALIRASEGADLLVVGSRGRGGFRGLLLGSVSQQCAHHAHCPIVIVPQVPRSA